MITATAKNWNELTQQEKNLWYDANHEQIKWSEKPSEAYERLNTSKKVDNEVKKLFAQHSVRLTSIQEIGWTLKINNRTFWVTNEN